VTSRRSSVVAAKPNLPANGPEVTRRSSQRVPGFLSLRCWSCRMSPTLIGVGRGWPLPWQRPDHPVPDVARSHVFALSGAAVETNPDSYAKTTICTRSRKLSFISRRAMCVLTVVSAMKR
jgi:hypothetical protein